MAGERVYVEEVGLSGEVRYRRLGDWTSGLVLADDEHDPVVTGTVYRLEQVEGIALFEEVGSATLVRLRLDHRAGLAVVPDGTRSWPIGELGLVGNDEAAELFGAVEHLVVSGSSELPAPCIEGGLAGWRAARDADRRIRETAEALRRQADAVRAARSRVEADDRFINPYSFVALPATIERVEPIGHHKLAAGRYMGTISVMLTTRTPLLVRTENNRFPRARGRLVVPGSGLKGSLRSLHETLCGGCLRVFEADYVPVYRQPMTAGATPRTLALVTAVTDGRPTKLQLCGEVIWFPAHAVHRVIPPAELRTGSRLSVALGRTDVANVLGRKQHDGTTGRLQSGDEWIAMVSGAGARGGAHTYYVAVGHLGSTIAALTDRAWDNYQSAAKGAEDVRRAQRAKNPQRRTPGAAADAPASPPLGEVADLTVEFDGELVGRRQAVTGNFSGGEVVWVVVDAKNLVIEMTQAVIWRERANTHAAGERTPRSLLPCTRAGELCVSCRIFGAADDEGAKGDGRSRQNGYRAHVRIGDAVVLDLTALDEPTMFAPQGAPRPGSGQFYLAAPNDVSSTAPPRRQWDQDRRPVRGRKFYWQHAPDPKRYRHNPAAGHSDKMASEAELLRPGTALAVTITFENLDEAQLGSLVGTLDPGRVLASYVPASVSRPDNEPPVLALRLGGGKPFGFGAVTASIDTITAYDATGRYSTGSMVALDPAALVAAFVETVPDEVRATWRQLAALLAVDQVEGRRVAYPPGANWSAQDRTPEAFSRGYEFFKNSAGGTHPAHPMLPLPAADELDQTMPILGYE